jgi:hypothetical protein
MRLASCKVRAYLSDSCLMILLRRLGVPNERSELDQIPSDLDRRRPFVRPRSNSLVRVLPQSPLSNYSNI